MRFFKGGAHFLPSDASLRDALQVTLPPAYGLVTPRWGCILSRAALPPVSPGVIDIASLQDALYATFCQHFVPPGQIPIPYPLQPTASSLKPLPSLRYAPLAAAVGPLATSHCPLTTAHCPLTTEGSSSAARAQYAEKLQTNSPTGQILHGTGIEILILFCTMIFGFM